MKTKIYAILTGGSFNSQQKTVLFNKIDGPPKFIIEQNCDYSISVPETYKFKSKVGILSNQTLVCSYIFMGE